MGNKNINLGLSIIIISTSLVVVLTLLPNSAPVSADSDSISECKSVEGLWITHPQPPEGMALWAKARTDETGKICVEFNFIPIAEDWSNRSKNNQNSMHSIISADRNASSSSNLDVEDLEFTQVLADSDFECKKTLGGMIRLPQAPEGMMSKATTKLDENGCAVTKFSFITIAEHEAERDQIRNLPNINRKTVFTSWNATSTSNADNETSEESP